MSITLKGVRCGMLSLLLAGAALLSGVAGAQESAAPSGPRTPIPFKTAPSPIESHGDNLIVVLVLLLAAAGGTLYVLKRRVPGFQLKLGSNGKRMRMVEQLRLNPRCTVYLIELDQREMLLAHCGDTLVALEREALTRVSVDSAAAMPESNPKA